MSSALKFAIASIPLGNAGFVSQFAPVPQLPPAAFVHVAARA
jgi:hypothetical protein